MKESQELKRFKDESYNNCRYSSVYVKNNAKINELAWKNNKLEENETDYASRYSKSEFLHDWDTYVNDYSDVSNEYIDSIEMRRNIKQWNRVL